MKRARNVLKAFESRKNKITFSYYSGDPDDIQYAEISVFIGWDPTYEDDDGWSGGAWVYEKEQTPINSDSYSATYVVPFSSVDKLIEYYLKKD